MNDTDEQETMVDRRVIVAAPTYLTACEVVDYLVSKDLPRENLTIAAEELRFRREVTGGMGAERAIVQGILSGVVTGLVFGVLFSYFSWIDPLISKSVLVLSSVLFGAVIGALLALAAHRFSEKRNRPYRVGRLKAGRYVVLATGDLAAEATRIARAINQPKIRQRAYPLSAGGAARPSRSFETKTHSA